MTTAGELNAITSRIIKAAIEVHRELGLGLLESVYERCMLIELRRMGVEARSQVSVPITYKGEDISDKAFCMNLLVEKQVIVELKSVKEVTDLDKKQLLSYLRLADKRLGLLINFNVVLLKEGITRIANALREN